ncbi:MAG TPA: hemolysin family protein [Anaerolineae bacterium]|nr:hemolysin family protein [Anaerolineae bacterium]
MNLQPTSELILLAVLIALNAFFAASEIAVISVPKLRLKQLIEEGNKTAEVLFRLADDSSRFLATIQVGITLMGFFASATAAVSLSGELARSIAALPFEGIATSAPTIAIILITLLLTIITLVLGELVPKSVALAHSERIALFVARPIDFLARLGSPLVRFLVWATNLIARPFGGKPRRGMPVITEEEIKTMVDAGQEGGVLEEDEKAMIYSVFEIGDTLAREVMVPRIDMVALDAGAPLLEAADAAINSGHSRIPVYEETVDHIVGILHAKDLLRVLRQQGRAGSDSVPLRDLARPAYFVPETKKVDELLNELQQRRVHMAVVIDEYGGTAGLVTIEDILEEIVGEIRDEYDESEEPLAKALGENEYELDSRMLIDDVNELLDVQLSDEESDTLGGFIYHQLGRVPAPGEAVEVEGLHLQVVNVQNRRIGKIRARRETPLPSPSGSSGENNGSS